MSDIQGKSIILAKINTSTYRLKCLWKRWILNKLNEIYPVAKDGFLSYYKGNQREGLFGLFF